MINKVENNPKFALFMGLSYCEKHNYEGWYKNHEHNERICDYNGLKYDTDWNLLMDVVKKISNIKGVKINMLYILGGLKIEINVIDCNRWANPNHIEAVYIACVKFIDWYNKKKT